MIKGPLLTPEQWKLLASACSTMSQAIILFALTAFFVPEVVNLSKDFSRLVALGALTLGLIILYGAVIIATQLMSLQFIRKRI